MVSRIQASKADTRVYTPGKPSWAQPAPNETMPTTSPFPGNSGPPLQYNENGGEPDELALSLCNILVVCREYSSTVSLTTYESP